MTFYFFQISIIIVKSRTLLTFSSKLHNSFQISYPKEGRYQSYTPPSSSIFTASKTASEALFVYKVS